MKNVFLIFTVIACIMAACTKSDFAKQSVDAAKSSTAYDNFAAKGGGSGGGNGGNNGGGGTQPAGLISAIGGAFRLIGGNSDSIQVNFTQAAPAAGYTLSFTSSDPAVQLPATFFAPAGTFNLHVPLTSSVITGSKNVTLTAKLGTESKSFVLKVFPLHVAFPAPQLQSPGNGAGFTNRIQVAFTWTGNADAYYHDFQVSDNMAFNNAPVMEVYVNDPVWAASYFNGLGMRYWRVRYVDGSGAFGPWSAVNRFEIKQ